MPAAPGTCRKCPEPRANGTLCATHHAEYMRRYRKVTDKPSDAEARAITRIGAELRKLPTESRRRIARHFRRRFSSAIED